MVVIRDVAGDLGETDDQDRLSEPISTDDDDEEALLEDLIDAMVSPEEAAIEASEASPKDMSPRSSRDDEFLCRSCHLILSRARRVEAAGSICRDCFLQASPVGA